MEDIYRSVTLIAFYGAIVGVGLIGKQNWPSLSRLARRRLLGLWLATFILPFLAIPLPKSFKETIGMALAVTGLAISLIFLANFIVHSASDRDDSNNG